MVQSSSNVPEYCGIVNMEQYVLVLKRRDPENSQISILERVSVKKKISFRMAKVILACGENEKQVI